MSLSGAVTSSHSTPRARNPPNTTAPNTVMIYPLPSHIVLFSLLNCSDIPVIPRRAVVQIPDWHQCDLRCGRGALLPGGVVAEAMLFGGLPGRCDTLSWLHAGCG